MFETGEYFKEITNVFSALDMSEIDQAISRIIKTQQSGNTIFTCGNGGSAYAASHYITDWNKMYSLKTGQNFKGISLCDNIGSITAYANDINYNDIFSGQLRSLGTSGDLLIVISGSGNSKNLIEALKTAKENSIQTMAFVGYDGGQCKSLSENVVHVPSFDMQFCEDIHLMLGHIIMKKICGYEIEV